MKKDNKIVNFLLKYKIILIVAILFLVIMITYVLYKSNSRINLEEKLLSIVETYYNDKIKGKVIGIKEQIVTLNTLEKAEYDITIFKEANCDLEESYSSVILEDPNETNLDKIKYSIQCYLKCSNSK